MVCRIVGEHGLVIATGRIVGKAWFMWLRDQRVPRVSVARFVRDDQHADISMAEVHPFEVSGTDAVVTLNGVARFLEVNVAPGLTETSLLPMAIESDGAKLGTVFADLVERTVAHS